MARIVVSEYIAASAVDEMARHHEVVADETLVDHPERLRNELAGASALLVRNRTIVDAELLESAPRLEVVGRLGVGLDNIDVAACDARGVAVRPATGANATTVAEYVMGALMALHRPALTASHRVIAGEWPRSELVGRELAGRQLGLIGYGAIAREVAQRARAFGMTIAAHDPYVAASDAAWTDATPLPLPELLATSDAVSVHVPLNDHTKNLLDRDRLASMKEGAVLVNTSRGHVVDEAALVEALQQGTLAGAALDVFADEPLDPESAAPLAAAPNLIVTPHIAGATTESNERVSGIVARAVLDVLDREAR